MSNNFSTHVFTIRTLIRIALLALSLTAIAQAQAADKASQQQSGENYMAGGGG